MDTIKKSAFFILLFFPIEFYAQTEPLNKISDSFNKYQDQVFQEKLFIHTDRSLYITGENLFFKIYLVDGKSHKSVNLSKIAYLELVDFDSAAKVQTKVALDIYGGDGSIYLPASLNSGKYILRAYTRWMRNFDSSFYFYKTITILNPFKPLSTDKSGDNSHDIQFFPEGGNLVQKIKSKVGFRVVDNKGKGISFDGILIDVNNDTILHFSPLKFGIGHFIFTPEKDYEYFAHIFDKNGNLLAQKSLPEVHEAGCSMSLIPNEDKELELSVQCKGFDYIDLPVFLIVHSRGKLILKDYRILDKDKTQFILNVKDLEDGINHITLFDNQNNPICERLFFRKPDSSLDITIKPDNYIYEPRKKITVDVDVQNAANAQLSMSVYRLDSLQPAENINIQEYLLLRSDLHGNIESPWYYFSDDVYVEEVTDNLMLTHGWRKFEWGDIIDNTFRDMDYIPEYRGPFVEAVLLHKESNKPVAGIETYLSLIGRDFVVRGSRSRDNGVVLFEMQHIYDNSDIILQANPRVDSLLKIDYKPPFSHDYYFPEPYNFSLTKSYKEQFEERSIGMQLRDIYFEDKRVYFPNDSLPFYGIPDEQYYLDDFTRFPVMEDVLREYVTGVFLSKSKGHYKFQVSNVNANHKFTNNPLVLVDGVPILNIDRVMELDPLKIQRIDVKTRKEFLGPFSFEGIVSFVSYDGELMNQVPLDDKMLKLEYKGLQRKRIYFTPIYESDDTSNRRLPDFRDLLFWKPDINVNESGHVKLSFYSSDRVGGYHIFINGISSSGIAGYGGSMIEVIDNP